MNEMKRILSAVRRAVDDYGMIEDGDRIAVGVSAGKDSLTLVAALAALRRFYPKRFELGAVTVDMGFEPPCDFSAVREFCEGLDVPYHVVPTEIAKIVFDVRKEKNPCGLCAKMRRGALHDECVRLGYGKLALGHHFDDVVDTFMLNLFYEGRLGSFSPVTFYEDKGLVMIRPLIYAPEKDIKYYVRHNPMKRLLSELERNNKGLRHRIFGALQRSGIDGYHEEGAVMGENDGKRRSWQE